MLAAHFAKLTPEHYNDQSLHLLAFDLMYCCRTYNFYKGLVVPSTRRTAQKETGTPELTPEEIALREEKRLARVDEIEQMIIELEFSCTEYTDISLIGVEVTANNYGVGTVIDQDVNKVKVQFAEVEKAFILDKKYASRPRFEDDDDIVSAFTEYGQTQEQIKQLQRELAVLG